MTGNNFRLGIGQTIVDFLEDLTAGQRLIIAGVVCAVLIAVCLGGGWKINRLKKDAAIAKQQADRFEEIAAKKEVEAAQYKRKIEHLEGRLVEIREIAKSQDEELQKLNVTVRDARGNMDRARRIRSIESSADELCKRLAEVEHPCEE